MHLITSRTVRSRIAVTLGCLAAALSTASLLAAGAPQAGTGSDSQLAGTWIVEVTTRNCTTNAPTGAPFSSLVTFHRDGTISESAGSRAFAPGQRSTGHGSWSRLAGGMYGQRMIALVLFDTPANLPGTPGFDPAAPISPGFFAGWSVVSHTLHIDEDGRAVSAGTNEFYKADGTVYRAGCSTAVAQRFN
jgi:hypothetical protein